MLHTKTTHKLQDGTYFTSVVLDHEEFCEICDILHASGMVDDEYLPQLKEVGYIAYMVRGTRTTPVFNKYEIEVDMAGFITRGRGTAILVAMHSAIGHHRM